MLVYIPPIFAKCTKRYICNIKHHDFCPPFFKFRKSVGKVDQANLFQDTQTFPKICITKVCQDFPTRPLFQREFGRLDPSLTRHRDNPRYDFPDHVTVEKCIRYSIPKLLLDTPRNVTDKIQTHSYHGFSQYIKWFYIDQYSDICNIPNCFVCNNQL